VSGDSSVSSPDGWHRDTPLFGATSVRRPLANDSLNSITDRDLPGEGQPGVSESAVTEQYGQLEQGLLGLDPAHGGVDLAGVVDQPHRHPGFEQPRSRMPRRR
jgi:hypothetical protein